MREEYANIGKDKIKYYLDKYCREKNIKPASYPKNRTIS
jgi:hypothetical protein